MNYTAHAFQRLNSRSAAPYGIIDVGAHFGEFATLAKQAFPHVMIKCIEANPACELALKLKNLNYSIALLSDKKETVTYYTDPKDPTSTGCSVFKEVTRHFENAETIELPTITLDELIGDDAKFYNMKKLDVQGAELLVLRGAQACLRYCKYIMIEMSFQEYNASAPLFPEVFSYLNERGYKIIDICDWNHMNDTLLQANFLFEKI